jgi:uncharacterized protein YpiB (UPF0302 family)
MGLSFELHHLQKTISQFVTTDTEKYRDHKTNPLLKLLIQLHFLDAKPAAKRYEIFEIDG